MSVIIVTLFDYVPINKTFKMCGKFIHLMFVKMKGKPPYQLIMISYDGCLKLSSCQNVLCSFNRLVCSKY